MCPKDWNANGFDCAVGVWLSSTGALAPREAWLFANGNTWTGGAGASSEVSLCIQTELYNSKK